MKQESIKKPPSEKDEEGLIDYACSELMTYGVWDGRMRTKHWIKKYLLKRQDAPEDLIFWTTGLLAAGLWQCREKAKEAQIKKAQAKEGAVTEAGKGSGGEAVQESAGSVIVDSDRIEGVLEAYFARWMRKGSPVTYMDDLLAGETLLALYEDCLAADGAHDGGRMQKAELYREGVEKLAAYALAYPVDEMGSYFYRAAQDNGYIFVDSIGLVCPFLYRYGAVFGKKEAQAAAVKQIVNFLAYGMDGITGLPYHGYAIRDGNKYGIIGWGRGVGWLLRGMNGCMTTEYGEGRLRDAYRNLVDVVLEYQRADGFFAWQMQAVDGPADTSATGMICVSIKQGIDRGILTESKYDQALRAGRNAVRKSVSEGRVYHCSGECEGFGRYPQRYGAYPWSLGPALMLL